jgi:hypothetical protein
MTIPWRSSLSGGLQQGIEHRPCHPPTTRYPESKPSLWGELSEATGRLTLDAQKCRVTPSGGFAP